MFILNVLILIVSLFFYKIYLGNIFNFPNLFNTLWLLMIAFSYQNILNIPTPSNTTYLYAYLSVVVFNISSIIFLMKRRNNNDKIDENSRLNIKSKYNLWTLFFSSVVSFFSLLPSLPSAFQLLRTSGFHEIRKEVFLSEDSGKMLLQWGINPLIICGIVMSVVLLLNSNEKINKKFLVTILVISIINCLMYTIIFAGRFLLMICFISVIFEIVIHYKGRLFKIFFNNIWLAISLVLSIILVIVISNQRVLSNLSFWNMTYVYFFAPLNLFNVYIENPDFGKLDDLFNGKFIFSGVYTPITVLLNRIFKTGFSIPLATLNEVTSNFVWITPFVHMNNNSTYLYAALRDFGILGLFIYPMVLAKYFQVVYNNFLMNRTVFTESLYAYSLAMLVFLLFEWMPARINIILAGVFMYLLYKSFFIKLK
ncbi:oligosaccharide repeat unit polymerase [Candidatus Enterococcus lowellii]|uniref:oligosaccharide repeat unit polymerase n=1 Tax=Candidatus Enterococcus lowellii TaxID=2230877 RepID=UPI001A9EFB6A|nr:oligosaccharide repeat unit polymerase [Enterococcus sp. DIV2402]